MARVGMNPGGQPNGGRRAMVRQAQPLQWSRKVQPPGAVVIVSYGRRGVARPHHHPARCSALHSRYKLRQRRLAPRVQSLWLSGRPERRAACQERRWGGVN